jgi:EAL domain-containing protein (putative c-di-GMP-specific phosphodiesterase class I)/GGDEF domain-containing protein
LKQRADTSLIDSLPDLVLVLSRDGILMNQGGGRAVPLLVPREVGSGTRLETVWPQPVAEVVMHLVRKCLASRSALETRFCEANQTYHARVSPQGPTRALCIISAESATGEREDTASASGEMRGPLLDRRGFMRRFQETLSLSVLTEKPLAVVILHLDGVENIARIGTKVAEQAVTAAVFKLVRGVPAETLAMCSCLGQLSESQLAFVVTTADRRAIEAFIAEVAGQVSAPSSVGELDVELTPHAGVAVLGQDGSSAQSLLDNARIAASEARNSGSSRARFFSDSVKMKSLARLDIGRELRDAIEQRAIGMRYVGRHELGTGRLVAWLAYVRWIHPLRGEVSPKEFLGVAEATGSAVALSRSVLALLGADFVQMARETAPDVRISFGPLRHHVLHEDFVQDIQSFLAAGAIPAERLEIRIPESTFAVLPPAFCVPLVALGVQLIVDEVGRGLSSLDQVARAPLWGMQLDRAWVEAIQTDEVALRVCRAGIAAAAALSVSPIAVGVDDAAVRQALLSLGCHYGSGDLYADTAFKKARTA